jgi:hypothetical protein
MADYLREELHKLLTQYDDQRRVVLAREQKVKEEDARFVAQFAELRRSVIRPAFEVAAAVLAERGHKVSISEQEFAVGPASKPTEAGISIHIVPAGTQSTVRDERGRALSISTRHYNKMVWIDTGKPLEVSKGTYPLEKIDRQLVEAELIAFVAAIVAGLDR